jgi:hypothetical protein
MRWHDRRSGSFPGSIGLGTYQGAYVNSNRHRGPVSDRAVAHREYVVPVSQQTLPYRSMAHTPTHEVVCCGAFQRRLPLGRDAYNSDVFLDNAEFSTSDGV